MRLSGIVQVFGRTAAGCSIGWDTLGQSPLDPVVTNNSRQPHLLNGAGPDPAMTPNRRMASVCRSSAEQSNCLQEEKMQFIGIDLHTNKFTCCYRDESSPADGKGGKRTETFGLHGIGLAEFCQTLSPDAYVLIEATITTFAFARLIKPYVKEAIVANTYELKQISLARKNTDKIDADILCRIVKMQVLSGEKAISPATIPPAEIQGLRGLFTACRLYKKQATQSKNRIHSILKENLYGFTQEEIFDKKSRKKILELETDTPMAFQISQLFENLEFLKRQAEKLQEKIMEHAEPFMREIDILTGSKTPRRLLHICAPRRRCQIRTLR